MYGNAVLFARKISQLGLVRNAKGTQNVAVVRCALF
jgi:hypothetical protein